MENLVKLGSLYRSVYRRSRYHYASAAAGATTVNYHDHQPVSRRHFRSSPQCLSSKGFDAKAGTNLSEPADEFEKRIFDDIKGDSQSSNSFFQKLDMLGRASNRSGPASNNVFLDGLNDSSGKWPDRMDRRLREAAYSPDDDAQETQEDYRPDVEFLPGNTYELKDLDLREPAVNKRPPRWELEVTTEEVLRKADFRNVRFLANFITEAGVIIKRKQTKISAKAQRKVAREIKTARAFGLMPFTTMGTKHFVFGESMEALDEDYEYEDRETYNFVNEAVETPTVKASV